MEYKMVIRNSLHLLRELTAIEQQILMLQDKLGLSEEEILILLNKYFDEAK